MRKTSQTPPTPEFISYPNVSNTKAKSQPTHFQEPNHLLSFSYTSEHTQEFTDSALRYYVDPPLGSSLKYGYERWNWQPDERGRIDTLLTAISKVRGELRSSEASPPEMDVVSWRGVMTKILIAPYEEQYERELNVMVVNGTLYLEEQFKEVEVRALSNMTPRERTLTYYGVSFESYCTSGTPPGKKPANRTSGAPLGWGGDVDNNVQWISVVNTRLGDMHMIMAGEVDCIRGKFMGKHDNYVELKTSNVIRSKQDEQRFERKLLKFYFQSYLLGVPEIVVGFRTPAGVLTAVQSFKTMQLPSMVQGKPGAWDPLVCLDWASGFLTELKRRVTNESEPGDLSTMVWRAKFVSRKGVSVRLLDGKEVEEVVNGEDRVGFLPRWYWNAIN